jgi:hypothetical protein
MNRPVTFDEFCRRCEKQGRSQYGFSRRHKDRTIQTYCEIPGAEERWREGQAVLEDKVRRVRELEALLQQPSPSPQREALRRELHGLYGWSFRWFKARGIITERQTHEHGWGAQAQQGAAQAVAGVSG